MELWHTPKDGWDVSQEPREDVRNSYGVRRHDFRSWPRKPNPLQKLRPGRTVRLESLLPTAIATSIRAP